MYLLDLRIFLSAGAPSLFTAHLPRSLLRCHSTTYMYPFTNTIQIATHLHSLSKNDPVQRVWYMIVFFSGRLACPSTQVLPRECMAMTRGVIASPRSLLLHTYSQLRYLIYRIATSTHSISPLIRPQSALGEALFFFYLVFLS